MVVSLVLVLVFSALLLVGLFSAGFRRLGDHFNETVQPRPRYANIGASSSPVRQQSSSQSRRRLGLSYATCFFLLAVLLVLGMALVRKHHHPHRKHKAQPPPPSKHELFWVKDFDELAGAAAFAGEASVRPIPPPPPQTKGREFVLNVEGKQHANVLVYHRADVESGWHKTKEDAWQDALERSRTYLAAFLAGQRPPIAWQPSLEDVQRLVRGKPDETVQVMGDIGEMRRVTIHLQLTAQDYARILKAEREQCREERIVALGKIFGVVLAVLALVALGLRVEDWTHGYVGLGALGGVVFVLLAGAALLGCFWMTEGLLVFSRLP
jgi:protein-S-isoprenylcysteine O-methyltransferase Ste14